MPRSNILLGGQEFKLDADADTSITADTDDQIDIKVGGADKVTIDSVGKVKFSNFISVGHTNAPSYGVDIQTADTTAYGMRIKSTEEGGSALIRMESDQADDNHDYRNIISDSSGDFRIQSYATGSFVDQFKIASGGNVTISDGDLVIGTTGHGIDFSATGDGSGTDTSELLDDYEEGTWTPLVRGSSTAGTASYSTQIGRYTKIGNLIHVNFVLQYSITSAAGDLEITGFPYSGSGGEPNDVGVLQHNQAGASYASNVTSYVPYMSSNVMSFRGNKSDGTAFASLAIQNMEYMRVTFVYTQA